MGCFTPDKFPVIDRIADNVTLVGDLNHGSKMHPISNSPFPWS